MSQDYRETLIRLDHAAGSAEIWTENRRIISKMRRLGATETGRQAKGVWFRLPADSIRFRNTVKSQSPGAKAASLAALSVAREAKRRKMVRAAG